eukprot:GHVQ01004177.1.p1 GENE.GHVQ01004177.1~~GHVQ01004177.1.p1  ORF type:complete len:230 (-),score=44.12 GHVQ01004177.1:584-1273(-)
MSPTAIEALSVIPVTPHTINLLAPLGWNVILKGPSRLLSPCPPPLLTVANSARSPPLVSVTPSDSSAPSVGPQTGGGGGSEERVGGGSDQAGGDRGNLSGDANRERGVRGRREGMGEWYKEKLTDRGRCHVQFDERHENVADLIGCLPNTVAVKSQNLTAKLMQLRRVQSDVFISVELWLKVRRLLSTYRYPLYLRRMVQEAFEETFTTEESLACLDIVTHRLFAVDAM